VIEKITEDVPDLQYIFDTIGNTTSSALSSRAFGDREDHICTVRPGKANTEQVTANTHSPMCFFGLLSEKTTAMANSIGQ
jgi:hypothetical protein